MFFKIIQILIAQNDKDLVAEWLPMLEAEFHRIDGTVGWNYPDELSDYLAELFVYATSSMSVALILSTLMLLMAVLTNIVSNNAAAVIGTPIAINIAQQLGASPEPFVLAVLFGANMSFVTPIGYKTNLLIMGAGGYKFNDFVKVGLPLAFIMWVAFSIILPVLYL